MRWPWRRKTKPWNHNTYAYRAEVMPAVPAEPRPLWEIPPDPFVPEDWMSVEPEELLPKEDYAPLTMTRHDGVEHLFGYVHKSVLERNPLRIYMGEIVEPHRVG